VGTTQLSGFFQPQVFGEGFFDPRVSYDLTTGRYIVAAVGKHLHVNPPVSTCYVAVSATSDPTGLWHKYAFDILRGGASNYQRGDYPSLGWDDQAVYVSVNMFPVAGGGSTGTRTLILDKTAALAGLALTPTIIENVQLPNGNKAFTIKPAEAMGPLSTGLLMSTYGKDALMLARVTNPLGAPSITRYAIPVSQWYVAGDAPQLGSSTLLDTVDDRLQKTVYRAGVLWTGHTVASSSGGNARVKFYRLDPLGSQGILDTEVVSDTVTRYFMPAIVPDDQGNAVAVFQGSSASIYPSIYHARYNGSLAEFEAPVLTAASQVPYVTGQNPNRWGDYTDAALDVVTGDRVWVQGELCYGFGFWKLHAARVPTR
jgi:hypothetical protein